MHAVGDQGAGRRQCQGSAEVEGPTGAETVEGAVRDHTDGVADEQDQHPPRALSRPAGEEFNWIIEDHFENPFEIHLSKHVFDFCNSIEILKIFFKIFLRKYFLLIQ